MTQSRQRALFGIPMVAALLVALAGWWSHGVLRRTLEARLRDELETVLNANVAAVEIWASSQGRLAQVLADDPEIRQQTAKVLATLGDGIGTNANSLGRLAPQVQLQRILDDRLKHSGFGAALVLSTNLQIVSGSGRTRNRLGEIIENEHAARVREALSQARPVLITPFKAGFGRGPRGRFDRRGPFSPGGPGRPTNAAGPGFRSNPGTNRFQPDPNTPSPRPARPPRENGASRPPPPDLNLMELVVPIPSETGGVHGALVLVLRPEEEFTRVLSVARPGETGETFAFDPAGRLISGSRFDDQLKAIGLLTNAPNVSSPLNIELRDPGRDLTQVPVSASPLPDSRPLMGMVAEAVAGGSGNTVNPVRDYRGVPAVGAWRWLPDHEFGVVTKIDAAEGFRPLRVLRWTVFTLIGLLSLSTVVMLVSSYRTLILSQRFDEARLKARQLGQYTLLEKIGEGAMGVVYRAQHALLRRETAVKLLLPDRADPDLVHQFEREVQLTCRLTHPNTIQIYDYGHTDDGIFYYAMELLRGMTLLELIERHGPLPEERVIHLLSQVCESLREAHAAGLIHRDIKPANLFLCERGGVPDTVKVLDFGLVRRVVDPSSPGSGISKTDSRLLGTPDYMAPETIRQPGFGDARSDLYAVAAVGYHLLTGEPVFTGTTNREIWDQQERDDPIPPHQRCQDPISAELSAVLLRGLSKSPADRPQDMTEFLNLLRTSPKASSWTLDRRILWWTRYGVPEHPAGNPPRAGSSPQKTLKIDIDHRPV